MTATGLSNRAEATTFSFIRETFTGLRRRRARIALRKHLLGLGDYMQRDIGLTRLDVMDGSI